MPDPTGRTIARIAKVNHAGEYGAIRIYRAQIFVAQLLYPDIVPILQNMLSDEIDHCDRFRHAMRDLSARPCRIMGLWGQGGFVLGAMTALLGRQGIWICTAAIERTVHQHLEGQIKFLTDCDSQLVDLIKDIQIDELSHLRNAVDRIRVQHTGARLLDCGIVIATNIAIWLSTWGDSQRMARKIA